MLDIHHELITLFSTWCHKIVMTERIHGVLHPERWDSLSHGFNSFRVLTVIVLCSIEEVDRYLVYLTDVSSLGPSTFWSIIIFCPSLESTL